MTKERILEILESAKDKNDDVPMNLVRKAFDQLPSAQPDLQPTCNQLATDCISRQDAIDLVRNCNVKEVTPDYMLIDKAETIVELAMLPSAPLYTEPSQKAIDLQHAHDIENVARMNYSKGAEDAWEFVRTVTDMTEAQRIQCFGGATCDLDEYYTYQEAKAKYEAWKKKEEEIRVGDEVIPLDTQHDIMVVTKLWTGEYRDEWADTIASDGKLFSFLKTSIKKTGRHFDEVEELLMKMKED